MILIGFLGILARFFAAAVTFAVSSMTDIDVSAFTSGSVLGCLDNGADSERDAFLAIYLVFVGILKFCQFIRTQNDWIEHVITVFYVQMK